MCNSCVSASVILQLFRNVRRTFNVEGWRFGKRSRLSSIADFGLPFLHEQISVNMEQHLRREELSEI